MSTSRFQRKKTPYGAFFLLLAVFLVLAYCVSGVCKLPNTDLAHLQENLLYTFMHPFSNWNEKTPAFLGIGMIAWFMTVSYCMYYYRDFHSDIEHGDADWLDVDEANAQLADKEDKYNRIITQNLRVSTRGVLSNNNALVIGSSGTFKTTSFMHQNLLQLYGSKVILDVKGDTQRKLGRAIKHGGKKICSLNFKQPEKSDRYNPFVYIEREDDMLRVVKALHDACRPKKEASMADPFWDDAVDLYLMAIFYYTWLDAREHNTVGTMNDVLTLANLETQTVMDPQTEEEVSRLQLLMDAKERIYGADYPPVRDYRKLKGGAPDTVRSVILMINGMLAICETAEVKRIFSGNDIDIREIGTGVDGNPEKGVYLFLVIPDNNQVYNWIVSMFYTQMFDILVRLSDDELKEPLPCPVEVHMDEFYAGAKPADADVLLGVIRSRNISILVYLQSISQIKTLFRDDKWETMMDNMAMVVYLGSGPLASSTHKFISEALSKTTADTRSDNVHLGRNGNSGLDFRRTGIDLMTPDQVKRMPPTECIVFLESRQPIYDTKAIPFDKPEYGFVADKGLKRRYKDALELGAYEHPVYTVYDPVHFRYITVEREERLKILEDPKEIETYEAAAQHDSNIYIYNIDEKDLLYLSWGHPKRSAEEVEKMYQEALKTAKKRVEDIKGLSVLQEVSENDVPNFGTLHTNKSSWNKDATFKEMLAEHWEELSQPEQEEICIALEEGFNEEQLKEIMLLDVEDMEIRIRAYRMERQNT